MPLLFPFTPSLVQCPALQFSVVLQGYNVTTFDALTTNRGQCMRLVCVLICTETCNAGRIALGHMPHFGPRDNFVMLCLLAAVYASWLRLCSQVSTH